MAAPQIARTDWAELQVEELLSVPLISEFVFRSPKHIDKTEKEVIDHLILHKQQCILLSQKAQENPDKLTIADNETWVLKYIQNALKQIRGAIRNPSDQPKWKIIYLTRELIRFILSLVKFLGPSESAF
jgi:hypothetical protein